MRLIALQQVSGAAEGDRGHLSRRCHFLPSRHCPRKQLALVTAQGGVTGRTASAGHSPASAQAFTQHPQFPGAPQRPGLVQQT